MFKFCKKPLAEAVAWRCSVKMVFLKFGKVHRKTGLRPAFLLKKRHRHMCFFFLNHYLHKKKIEPKHTTVPYWVQTESQKGKTKKH